MKLTALVAALVLPTLASGALRLTQRSSPDVQVKILSPGSASCGTWLEARAAERAGKPQDIRVIQLESYTFGYVTAYNTFVAKNGDALGSLDAAGHRAFIDKYCGDNPTEMFVSSITALIGKVSGPH